MKGPPKAAREHNYHVILPMSADHKRIGRTIGCERQALVVILHVQGGGMVDPRGADQVAEALADGLLLSRLELQKSHLVPVLHLLQIIAAATAGRAFARRLLSVASAQPLFNVGVVPHVASGRSRPAARHSINKQAVWYRRNFCFKEGKKGGEKRITASPGIGRRL